MKETYDIIIEKLEQDKLSFDREISEVIESVEYDSISKIQYDRAKAIKDYLVDVIDGVYGNTLGDNKEDYFNKLTKERD